MRNSVIRRKKRAELERTVQFLCARILVADGKAVADSLGLPGFVRVATSRLVYMENILSSARRIAVLGAGGAGSCTALELARRGHTVELFEREEEAITQASYAAEGKVHLGFIYAKDSSLRTARLVIEGALEFAENLGRWIDFDPHDALSTPFMYCVHRGSLMDPDALGVHYDRCTEAYDEIASETGLDYLGLGAGSRARRLTESEFPQDLDPAYFSAVFQTTEYGIDPRRLAELLQAALHAEPRIHFRPSQPVRDVESMGDGYEVTFQQEDVLRSEKFTDVINATWHRRLPLDRKVGIHPPAPWSHRYKFGSRLLIPLHPDELPSCTSVQGPFGDIVNYRQNGLFLSWYPTGRTGMSTEESPPDWHRLYSPTERMKVFDESFGEWVRRCPSLEKLPLDLDRVDPYGGVIYALGTTDVDDQASGLHDSFDVGIQSVGRYHSLDPGKFTLIPYWAIRMADRLEAT